MNVFKILKKARLQAHCLKTNRFPRQNDVFSNSIVKIKKASSIAHQFGLGSEISQKLIKKLDLYYFLSLYLDFYKIYYI